MRFSKAGFFTGLCIAALCIALVLVAGCHMAVVHKGYSIKKTPTKPATTQCPTKPANTLLTIPAVSAPK